jgi:hypothetical protein
MPPPMTCVSRFHAHSGHREQPDRSMMNASIGDRDRSGATLGVGG